MLAQIPIIAKIIIDVLFIILIVIIRWLAGPVKNIPGFDLKVNCVLLYIAIISIIIGIWYAW